MSDRKRVEAEARDAADSAGMETGISGVPIHAYATGFIAGRTVTAEQVEAAAEAAFWDQQDMQKNTWHDLPEPWKEEYRSAVRAALTAAGLLIEGEHDG